MAFTGEIVHGWHVANKSKRRRVVSPQGIRWVDEPVFELVKGQRHVEARGQDGIDPRIVLDRAISAALRDDIRQAADDSRGDWELVARLTAAYDDHEQRRTVREIGWAVRRAMGRAAVFAAASAGAGAKAQGA